MAQKIGNRHKWLIAIAVGLAFWFSWPVVAYQLASAIWIHFPDSAESLAEHAILQSGGDYPNAQVLRSRILLTLGRSEEATGSWLTVTNIDHCSHTLLLQFSAEALQRGEIHLAMDIAKKSHEHFPKTATSTKIMSLGNTSLRNIREAEKWSKEWTEIAPDSYEAWANRMENLSALLNVYAAIDAGETALKLAPSSEVELKARRSLTDLYLSLGDANQADLHCKWVMQNSPITEPADFVRRAHGLRLQRKLEQAMDAVETALRRDPNLVPALMIRGLLQADAQHHDLAIRDFTEVIRQEPHHRNALYKLSRSLAKTGRQAEAEEYMKKAEALTTR